MQIEFKNQAVRSLKSASSVKFNRNPNPQRLAFQKLLIKKKLVELEQALIPAGLDTYTRLLTECGSARALSEGRRVHAHIVHNGVFQDTFLSNLILSMYGKCGSVKDACNVFNNMVGKTVATWNTLISAYAQHGDIKEALRLLTQMQTEGIKPNRITCFCIANASDTLTKAEGKLIHDWVMKNGFGSDSMVMNSLISMYNKCGCLQKAQEIFDSLPCPDLVSWNSIIGTYSRHGFGRVAISLFYRMQARGIKPNRITFVSVLHACCSRMDLEVVKSLHRHADEHGYKQDVVVGSALINVYGKCGSVGDSRRSFDEIPKRDIVTCNAMIGAYVQNGYFKEAFELFEQMGEEGLQPDKVTFLNVLGACTDSAALAKGKQIHSLVMENELLCDVSVTNALVNMYGNCGSLEDARAVFDKIHRKNVISWTTMIGAYAQLGAGKEAFQLFHQMQVEGLSPNEVTLLNVLNACHGEANLSEGELVHTWILKNGYNSDVVVVTALVNMYGKCGNVEKARRTFEEHLEKDVALWNAMITVYVQHGFGKEALSLFHQMQDEGNVPNNVTFICALEACSSLEDLAEGKLLHAIINEHGFSSDLAVANALITMYGHCQSSETSQQVFDAMPTRDLISWNAIIGAHINCGYKDKALQIFVQMRQNDIKPDKVTLVSILGLYTTPTDLEEAKSLHSRIIHEGLQTDTMIGNALIVMYGKCSNEQYARKVYDEMPKKDIISWNSMLTVYIQDKSHCREALQLYNQMQEERMKPDKVTFVSILNACANLADLREGIKVHDDVLNSGIRVDTFLGNALINLYAKCGELQAARFMFDRLFERDVVSWNVMITAYAQHGRGEMALQLFNLMQQEGMKPDRITIITVLSACSHAGLVDQGYQVFLFICKEFGYLSVTEHYGSMIDLFGRAGHLDYAEDLLNKMPFEPSAGVWMALLNACKIHGDLDRARRAAEHAVRLEPLNNAPYLVLSSMYAAACRWCDAAEVRGMMTKNKATILAGC